MHASEYVYYSAGYIEGFESPACAQPALEAFSSARCDGCVEGATETNGVCVPSSSLYSMANRLDHSEELTGGVKMDFSSQMTYEELEEQRQEEQAVVDAENKRKRDQETRKTAFIIFGPVLAVCSLILLCYLMKKVSNLESTIKGDVDMVALMASTESVDIKGNENDMKEHQELIMAMRQEAAEFNAMRAAGVNVGAVNVMNGAVANPMAVNQNGMAPMVPVQVNVAQVNAVPAHVSRVNKF